MHIEGINKEMVYLCIGDDLLKIKETELFVEYFQGVKYYVVDKCKIICGEKRIFCSCNENYCWHIFKVVLDEKSAKSK